MERVAGNVGMVWIFDLEELCVKHVSQEVTMSII